VLRREPAGEHDPPLGGTGALDVLRVLLLPGAIDHPRDLPVAAEEHAVTPPMAVLARIELRQVAVRVAALADVDGDREHGVRNRENRRSAPRSLAGEDAEGQYVAGRHGDHVVLLPRPHT